MKSLRISYLSTAIICLVSSLIMSLVITPHALMFRGSGGGYGSSGGPASFEQQQIQQQDDGFGSQGGGYGGKGASGGAGKKIQIVYIKGLLSETFSSCCMIRQSCFLVTHFSS